MVNDFLPSILFKKIVAKDACVYVALDKDARKKEEKIINNIPIKRIGVPDDISSLTKFLASDKASYITGQTFHVNGGMFM